MKIGIIGAGAMGCLYAALLAEKNKVTLFDVSRDTVEAIRAHGVCIREADGAERTVSVPAVLAGEGGEVQDLVILFVKDTASEAALAANEALIGADTLLLSLQNGMGNEEIMERHAPRGHVLLGTTKHNCVTVAPGVIFHSGAGVTRIGSPAGDTEEAGAVVRCFAECGVEAEVSRSVRRLLWEKLFVNLSVNPVTALLDCTISVCAEDPGVRELLHSLIREAAAVAAADGESFDAESVYESVIATAQTLSAGKTSMCQDIERGRRTEIDFINGAVVRLGKKYGIPTPYNETVAALVHARERLNAL